MVSPLIWNDALVRKFWDQISQEPEKYFTYQFGDKIVKGLAKHVSPNGQVLDYGCGTGFLLHHLANEGFRVFGTDASPKSVEFVNHKFAAIPRFGGAKLLEEQLVSGERFDAVFIVEVIEHLDDNNLSKLLRNVRSLLNPHGVAIFTTPNQEKLADAEVYCPCCDHTFHRWQHVRSWNVKSLQQTLAENGFTVKACYGTDFAHRRAGGFRGTLVQLINSLIMPEAQPHLVAVCA